MGNRIINRLSLHRIIRKLVLAILMNLAFLFSKAQDRSYAFYELYQLDSLAQASPPGKYFGELYYHFLLLVEEKLENADTSTLRLVRNFEKIFARFYINACEAFQNKKKIELPAWQFYFSDTGLSRAQYYLLGANAHLNGGLAQAIADSYTPEEWKKLKKEYVLFNSCLNITLRKVYDETLSASGRARLLSFLGLGLTRPLSNYYLYKWRKRQMRLTGYYYAADPRFEKLRKKIDRKRTKIDRMIVNNIR